MSRYWLCLGSNLGDRAEALQHAVDALAHEGVAVQAVSAVYETAPQDVEDQPPFLNAVAIAESDLDPSAVLAVAKRVERAAGRDLDGLRYGPRPIDIDLLLWDGGAFEADDPHLVIPHLRLAERRFVLVPLLDVDPALTLPDGTSVAARAEAIPAADQPVSRTDYPLVPPRSAAPGL
jgi:2-amino-4-hydroxy-6-hydroxymethyldihydropteridine diphosphokinase